MQSGVYEWSAHWIIGSTAKLLTKKMQILFLNPTGL